MKTGPFKTFKNRQLVDQPGAILVVSGDRTTYPDFAHNVATVKSPPGTRLLWEQAGGGDLADARNRLVKKALDGGAEWVWCIDDDHVFTAEVLLRLLRHNQDVVVPLVSQRHYPHGLVMWENFPIPAGATDAELLALAYGDTRRLNPMGRRRGLVEIGHGGTGGMLIAARVLRALPPRWFQWQTWDGGSGGEDTWFCLTARRAGFRIWCDLETPIGHLTTAAVWPDVVCDENDKVERVDICIDTEIKTMAALIDHGLRDIVRRYESETQPG
jgi:hypothetical protein